ncbi:MAG: hypothetical protein IV100_24610 [Myxococcales bacterium]|nr:hypothetical protein [Myxococcales bacterium]
MKRIEADGSKLELTERSIKMLVDYGVHPDVVNALQKDGAGPRAKAATAPTPPTPPTPPAPSRTAAPRATTTRPTETARPNAGSQPGARSSGDAAVPAPATSGHRNHRIAVQAWIGATGYQSQETETKVSDLEEEVETSSEVDSGQLYGFTLSYLRLWKHVGVGAAFGTGFWQTTAGVAGGKDRATLIDIGPVVSLRLPLSDALTVAPDLSVTLSGGLSIAVPSDEDADSEVGGHLRLAVGWSVPLSESVLTLLEVGYDLHAFGETETFKTGFGGSDVDVEWSVMRHELAFRVGIAFAP